MKLFKRRKKKQVLKLYEEQELDRLEAFIDSEFGEISEVFHEIVSSDIHIDIAIIKPNETRDYYTLVTMGMGAHQMNTPLQLKEFFGHSELMLCLPSDWDIKSGEEAWYWPKRLLKVLARLPINSDTWLGYGHSIDNLKPFDTSTNLSSSMLISPKSKEEEPVFVDLETKRVHFYQVVPLYQSEVDFKLENGIESLVKYMSDEELFVIDSKRRNCMG